MVLYGTKLGMGFDTHERKTSTPVYAGRAASASPATGLASTHKAQQEALIDDALTIKGN